MSQQLLEQILNELKEVKQEMSAFKSEQLDMKQEMSAFKNEQLDMKQEITSLKDEQQKTNERLTSIEAKQQFIYEQTAKLSEYHAETQAKLEQAATKKDLAYYDKKIGEHEREIFNLKNA